MIPLRDTTPTRRKTPTHSPTDDDWTKHKSDLKEDFNSYCGYCHSYDGHRHTYFEVDHFIPKSFFKDLGNISLTEYSNLVYSCKFCNNKKLSKWPTKSETIHNDGKIGFIDPCNPEFDTHFYRTPNGAIRWKTDLGKWMFQEAFRFDERERSIIVLWNMDRLRKIIDALILLLEPHAETSDEYKTIKEKLGTYTLEYYLFHRELIAFYA